MAVKLVHGVLVDGFEEVYERVGASGLSALYASRAEQGSLLEVATVSPRGREAGTESAPLQLRKQFVGSSERHEFIEEPVLLGRS